MDSSLTFCTIILTTALATWLIPAAASLVLLLGICRLASTGLSACTVIFRMFCVPRKNLVQRYGKDSYVLVTGGANGIGLEYARQFAQAGFSLVIVDRSEEGLRKAAQEILEVSSGCRVVLKVCDLQGLVTYEDFERLLTEFWQYDISIVVNNAGFMDCDRLEKATEEDVVGIIRTNCIAVVMFSNIFYNRLISRSNKSCIINMSSTIGGAPAKIVPMYAPTKGFVKFLSQGLAKEADRNIDILTVCPGSVDTKFTLNRKFIDTCSSKTVVNRVLDSMGNCNKMSGWWLHEIWDQTQTSLWYFNHGIYTHVMEFFGKYFGYDELINNIKQSRQ
ncbi:unnamed protein product [Moneuplotes crassus]|uniref:Uncharacterized protein n=1 Tax=Euplotes crassus TaxID=5936 RepID=A0AAD1UM43_EUPCR|nr:unnamed protein product [Moneuplotes crassus]